MCIYAASSMKWPWTSGAWGPWDNYHLRMFICACVCLNICMFLCLRIYDHMSLCVFVWIHRFVVYVCVCSKPLRKLIPVFVRMCVYVSVCVCVWLNTCVCMSVLVLVLVLALVLALVLVLVPEAPWTIIAKQLIAALMVSWTPIKIIITSEMNICRLWRNQRRIFRHFAPSDISWSTNWGSFPTSVNCAPK